MSMKHLYISPHFDDVVFSCAGKIMQDVEAGIDVTVVTVFSKGDDSYAQRLAENIRALNLLQARGLELGFEDAPFRHSAYYDFRSLILEDIAAADAAVVATLATQLRGLVCDLSIDRVYAPLAVGTHVDHRLCFSASLQADLPKLSFYEDRPYALCSGAVEARLYQLGARPDPVAENHTWYRYPTDIALYLQALSQMSYVQQYLPGGEARVACFDLISASLEQASEQGYQAHFQHYDFGQDEFSLAQRAYGAYASQQRAFVGTFAHNAEMSVEYAQRIRAGANGQSLFTERYWQLNEWNGCAKENNKQQRAGDRS
ncbi:PIG-L family deacetylase [Corallincola spongiicola]|uniref:PIG-L family deacetylase n=2 Tax=Corallincola spongiicola TaxID=2520508 RepID=A0ABY1WT78_9GAMM|nr:PIG-L family deacetylase [Corallincola spongiicola]